MGTLFKNIVKAIGKVIRLLVRTFTPAEDGLKKIGEATEGFFGPGAVDKIFGYFGAMFVKYVAKPVAGFLDAILMNPIAATEALKKIPGQALQEGENPVKKLRGIMGLKENEFFQDRIKTMEEDFAAAEARGDKLNKEWKKKNKGRRAGTGEDAGGRPADVEGAPAKTPGGRTQATGGSVAPSAAVDETTSGRVDDGPTRVVINIDREKLFDLLVYPELKKQFHIP